MERAVVVLALAALGCAYEEVGARIADTGAAAPGADVSDARELAVHAHLAIEVDDVRDAYGEARALVTEHGGFVARGSDATSGHGAAGIDARVPADRLASFRRAAHELGAVVRDDDEVEDVTDAHRDLSARLRNARAREDRLLALLADRTATLADVLAAEQELARARETIELLDGEERALAERVALARVEIEIRPRAIAFDEHPVAAVASALSGGIRAARALAVGAFVVLAAAGPSVAMVTLPVVMLVLFARRMGRRPA